MSIFNAEKAIRSMQKTPIILQAVLLGLTTEQAQSAFDTTDGTNVVDGARGWNVVEVVGHLNDWEQVFFGRSERMLNEDDPNLPGYNQEELVKASDYAHQDLAVVLASYLERRQRHLDLLSGLSDEQWARPGIYPGAGTVRLLEHATNISLHDVNHIEQIVHILA